MQRILKVLAAALVMLMIVVIAAPAFAAITCQNNNGQQTSGCNGNSANQLYRTPSGNAPPGQNK